MITCENARELGRKGNLIRWSRPKPENPIATPIANPTIEPDFASQRLVRVRQEILRQDEMQKASKDPDEIEKLSRSLKALSEQERILAGRPMPGSLKPSSKPARRLAPAEPMPELGDSPQVETRLPAADDPSAPNG